MRTLISAIAAACATSYATERVSGEEIECEFVCIPRPLERAAREHGGPLRYRVAHTAKLWKAGERPALVQKVIEGNPKKGLATTGS